MLLFLLIKALIPNKSERRSLVNTSSEIMYQSDSKYASEDREGGDADIGMATMILDVATDLTFGVGLAKDVYAAFTGRNIVTGENLSTLDQSFAIIGVLSFGYGSKVLKAGKGLLK